MGSGKNVGLKRLLDYREYLNFGIQISFTSTHEGTVRALIFAGLNFRGFRGLEAIHESLNQRKV